VGAPDGVLLQAPGAEIVARLHIAAEDFQHSLAKKKDSDATDDGEKITRIDALGIIMIKNGEEYGEESAYGTSPAPHCEMISVIVVHARFCAHEIR
jgi:hypothetical protein